MRVLLTGRHRKFVGGLAAARKYVMGPSSRAFCRAARRRGPPARAGRDRGALTARSDGVSRTPQAPRSPRGRQGRTGGRRDNATATTFDWRFTATDLDDLPRPRRRSRQAPITKAARPPRTSGGDDSALHVDLEPARRLLGPGWALAAGLGSSVAAFSGAG